MLAIGQGLGIYKQTIYRGVVVMGMQNSANVGSAVEGWGDGLNAKFKVVKQLNAEQQPSIKN